MSCDNERGLDSSSDATEEATSTDELLDLIEDSVRRFAAENVDAASIDRDHRIPTAVVEGMAELGLFGLSIPEAFGGAGLGMRASSRVVAALAETDRSVATTLGLHLGLGTRGLVAYGTPAQRERYLPSLAEGTRIAAFAATEPNAGSDLRAVATRALADDRGGLTVDGAKVYVTNGGFAGLFTILACTPGLGGRRRGHGLLLLEGDDAGLSRGAEEQKLGLRGSSTVSLHLDGVRIDADRVIGEPGAGMEHMHHVLAWGRSVMAAGCTGAARAALREAVRHTATRRQFGRTLDRFPIVQEQLADMASLRFAMEALVAHVASEADDPAVLAARSLAAKVVCSEGNWEIADRAVQLHGGAGFIEETPLPLLLRDARITRIFEGANDVLLVHAGTLEATAPRQREPLHPTADALHQELVDLRTALAEEHGIRLVRRQRLLRQLGLLAVWSQAVDAAFWVANAQGTAHASALAAHYAGLVGRRWRAAQPAPPPLEGIEAIAGALADQL